MFTNDETKQWRKSLRITCIIMAPWKVSKYGVISGPYFPAFELNTERYSECGEIQTRNNSGFGHFSRSAWHHENNFQSLFKQSRILVSRDNIPFCEDQIWGESFRLSILSTQIFPRKEFDYYFLKKDWAS